MAALAGCASQWSPRTSEAGFTLQWPPPPGVAKVTYLRSLEGFAGNALAGRLRTLAWGERRTAEGAFALPAAVATAPDGRIAVADVGCQCVHLFVAATRRYQRLVGPAAAPLQSPVAVAFGDEGRLWVSDSAGRVLGFAADGTVAVTLGGAGEATFGRPTGLAWDPGGRRLFVVDTLASRVFAFDPAGRPLFSFGGRGGGTGELNFPTHAFWSAARAELFVSDTLNFRIAVFDGDGHPRPGFGRHGDGSGDLAMPKGVAVDGDGVVYVADARFDVVQLFDRQGEYLLPLGRRGTQAGELWLPSGLFINDDHELYVCDTYNHRVQVFRIATDYAPSP